MAHNIIVTVLVLLLAQMVRMDDQNSCPPARVENLHLDQMFGIWHQYVYSTTSNNTVDFFSCEILNVTIVNGFNWAVITVPPNISNSFYLKELPGPSILYVRAADWNFQFIETPIIYNSDSTKVAIANIFFQARYSATFIVLSSRHGFLNTNLHDDLLRSAGYRITSNTTIVPTSQCPTMVSTIPNF